jgi:nucleotide-binding universal stress UspA family protein
MTIVAAYAPDGRGRAVLHLAAMLARSAQDEIVVCAVVPESWPPSPARVDAEYQAHLERAAEEALEQARARLPTDLKVSTVVRHARSAPRGLLDAAEQYGAAAIVTGSSAAGGSGHVSIGSTTARLLHSSAFPVALAPRGFRRRPDARVERVTVAYGGSEGAEELLTAAAAETARVGATLRLASFAVHARPPYTAGVGRQADEEMITEFRQQIEASARPVLERIASMPEHPRAPEVVVGRGESWEEALDDLDWEEGDVLVVGSSSIGPVARVFLGSRATKIVRHSPVPAIVVPRAVATELAEEAATGLA